MKQLKPKIDPEISSIFGKRNEEEYCQLKANIDLNGQLDEGVVWKEYGILLDGHGRMQACSELGRDFRYKVLSFEDRQEAIDWVWQNQLGRRNLAKDDRDMLIAVRYKRLKAEKEKATENQGGEEAQSEPLLPSRGPGSESVAKQVAAEAKVSTATVKRAVEKVESNFCDRCQRVGVVKNCQKCAEKQATKPKKKPAKDPKKGSELIDWKGYEAALGVVIRLSDLVAKHYKGTTDRGVYERATATIVRVKDEWKKKITGGGK